MQAEAEGSIRVISREASISKDGKGPNAYTYSDNRGHTYLKVWLLDASLNKNFWGVTPESIPKNINTAIGKPLVLYQNTGREPDARNRRVGEYDHPYLAGTDTVEHALAYQDLFRVGTFIDVFESDTRKGEWWGVAEVTDPDTIRAMREDTNLPMFVSPMIHLLDQSEPEDRHSKWSFIHSAIVQNPAYGTAKAYISGECSGSQQTCMLQLRKAAISHATENNENSCGFCRYRAMKAIQLNVRQASTNSFSSSSLGKNGQHFKNRKGNLTEDNSQQNNERNSNNKDNNSSNTQPKEEQEQVQTQKTTAETKYKVNEKTGAPTQMQEVSTETSTEKSDAAEREKEKNQQPKEKEKEKNRQASDLREAAEIIASQATRIQNLELKLQTAQADNETLRSVNNQFNTRLASLEEDRSKQLAAIRQRDIESYVNTAAAYKLLTPQQRQAQIETFVKGSISLDEIKSMNSLLNESVEKQYNNFPNRQASYNSRLNVGTRDKTIEVRAASANPAVTPSTSATGEPSDEVPHWLDLPNSMFRRNNNSANNGGVQ